jgi:DNA-directed RNA polymerase subunit L
MEIEVLEKTNKKLIFHLKGADHTLCNPLKRELYADEDVKVASYTIDHPLVRIPKFIVETNGKKAPEKALVDAAKRLQKTNEKVLEAFKKIKI